MFETAEAGHLICEECAGAVELMGRTRPKEPQQLGSWEFQCLHCGRVYLTRVTPEEIPLIPE